MRWSYYKHQFIIYLVYTTVLYIEENLIEYFSIIIRLYELHNQMESEGYEVNFNWTLNYIKKIIF